MQSHAQAKVDRSFVSLVCVGVLGTAFDVFAVEVMHDGKILSSNSSQLGP